MCVFVFVIACVCVVVVCMCFCGLWACCFVCLFGWLFGSVFVCMWAPVWHSSLPIALTLFELAGCNIQHWPSHCMCAFLYACRHACLLVSKYVCMYACMHAQMGVCVCACVCMYVRICIVLYCIVLCCIVLYRIVLSCIVLYCIVLYCIAVYCIVLYCIVLWCNVYVCMYACIHVCTACMECNVSMYGMLHYVIICYAMQCCTAQHIYSTIATTDQTHSTHKRTHVGCPWHGHRDRNEWACRLGECSGCQQKEWAGGAHVCMHTCVCLCLCCLCTPSIQYLISLWKMSNRHAEFVYTSTFSRNLWITPCAWQTTHFP